ncbi:hypothetical protein BDP27DRAFT_1425861 [Rhodocollybia butyracea]|uniref:Uncharacterized protein n=1 Tax=Rhodocollybia butyracea TaxID=206335 RepID=A0A9P5PJI2_9AGAR|nr:hypothetical protein BDP27DRAFT_1425861 [Rhodocollybia butyracea]
MAEEPDYVVTLATNADVGVLQFKEWFDCNDESRALTPGLPLNFPLKSDGTHWAILLGHLVPSASSFQPPKSSRTLWCHCLRLQPWVHPTDFAISAHSAHFIK